MKTNQLIQIADNYVIGNSLRITHSTTQPSSPSNGDLWWEPGARYPQPWEWDSASSNWMSQPVSHTFDWMAVTATNTYPKPVEFYTVTTDKIKLIFINAFIQTTGTAQSGTNFYGFQTQYLLGTGVYTLLYNWPENTGTVPSAMGANASRRINLTPNLYLPGNAWNIAFKPISFGTPGTINVTLTYWMKFPRP